MKTLATGLQDGNDTGRNDASAQSPQSLPVVSEPLAHAFGLLKSSGIPLGLWRIQLDGVDGETAEAMIADAVGHLGAVTSLPCGNIVFLQFSGLFRARRGRRERRWQPYLVVGMIAERLERISLQDGGSRAIVTFLKVRADEFAGAAELIASLDSHLAQRVIIDMPGFRMAETPRVRSVRADDMVAVNDAACRKSGGDCRNVAAGGR